MAERCTSISPEGITDEQLLPILKGKAPWIAKKLREINEIEDPIQKEFVSGEKFSYFGRHYRLKVYKAKRGNFFKKQSDDCRRNECRIY